MYANPDSDPDYQKDSVVEDPTASGDPGQATTMTEKAGR